MGETTLQFTVDAQAAGQRLDAVLAQHAPNLTRSQAEKLIRAGVVLVNGQPASPGYKLEPGDVVEAELPETSSDSSPQPEALALDILFEDEHLLVLNKPQGLIVHPGAGRSSGTLVNALLAHTSTLARGSGEFRPGIVHRLDKDTSGLIVVAKTDEAYAKLTQQVQAREMQRRYLALVWGTIPEDQLLIDIPIGRHPRHRTRMAAVTSGRAATTEVIVLQRGPALTLVEARLRTGRTHQIRVHLAHLGCPVVGDKVYGLRRARAARAVLEPALARLVVTLPGQALHAHWLQFRHPVTGQDLTFIAPTPGPMARLLSAGFPSTSL
jgi:23S rRNA pseudouridine1911/1915/1917 synthase